MFLFFFLSFCLFISSKAQKKWKNFGILFGRKFFLFFIFLTLIISMATYIDLAYFSNL